MFDFEKLQVYTKAKAFNKKVDQYLKENKPNRTTKDQLRRASFSIMLNIAEGSGRFTNPDRRRFYIIARGSLFECVAIFDYLNELEIVTDEWYQNIYVELEELSKMLYSLIRSLE